MNDPMIIFVVPSPCWPPAPRARRRRLEGEGRDESGRDGAKKIPGDVAETAKGVGHTMTEGAKCSGEKVKDAEQAAAPPAKSAWGNARDSVATFFTSLSRNRRPRRRQAARACSRCYTKVQ